MDVDAGAASNAPPPTSASMSTTDPEVAKYLASMSQSPLAVSPSASFAKLSLQSPVVDDNSRHKSDAKSPNATGDVGSEAPYGPSLGVRYPPVRASSPSPRGKPGSLSSLLNDPITVPGPYKSSSSLSDARSSSSTHDTHPESRHDTLTPQSSLSPLPSSLSPPPGSEPDLEPESDPNPVPEPEIVHDPVHRTPTPQPRTPTPPPPPTPQPKVKMSLKDFAMRRKKQREEEMAKVGAMLASPVSLSGAESISDGIAHGYSFPETSEKGSTSADLRKDGLDDTNGDVAVEQQQSSEFERNPSWSSPAPESPPANGATSLLPYHTETLEAKTELMEIVIPRGLVCPDDGSDLEGSPPERPRRHPVAPLNGDSRSFPPAPGPGRPPSRGVKSYEEGEFAIGGKRPPLQQQQRQRSPGSGQMQQPMTYTFTPRSHSPPTQPRSFQNAGSAFTPSSFNPSSISTPPGFGTTTPPYAQAPGRTISSFPSSSSSPTSTGTGSSPYRHRSQSQSYTHPTPNPYSYSQQQQQQQQQPTNFTTGSSASARPLPRGPRALQISANNGGLPPPIRTYSGGPGPVGPGPPSLLLPPPPPPPHFIPRRPSADRERERERERVEWDRDRGWPARPVQRGRGGGPGSGWR